MILNSDFFHCPECNCSKFVETKIVTFSKDITRFIRTDNKTELPNLAAEKVYTCSQCGKQLDI